MYVGRRGTGMGSYSLCMFKDISGYHEGMTEGKEFKMEESNATFQFGGGKKRKSAMKLGMPFTIGNLKVMLVKEEVTVKNPLLIEKFLQKIQSNYRIWRECSSCVWTVSRSF